MQYDTIHFIVIVPAGKFVFDSSAAHMAIFNKNQHNIMEHITHKT